MPSVAVLAADGFETIECLTMVDVMRRGGVRATLVSIMPTREVVSSLQIPVTCDALFDEINFDEYDCVVLPGGLPGATNLRADQRVCDVVCEFAATKHVAAICAAPFILGELDLLEGRHATCFPGFEKSFPEGAYTGEKVTQDGNIITASGMAQSLPFALELLRTLAGDKAVEKVAEGIQLRFWLRNRHAASSSCAKLVMTFASFLPISMKRRTMARRRLHLSSAWHEPKPPPSPPSMPSPTS